MKQIKAVIIDDEAAAIEVISELSQTLASDIYIAATARNGLEAVRTIQSVRPELIFLDVDMPMMNGLQVLEKFPGHEFEVIFTTGSASYALSALKLQAVDYLLKPIDPGDFLVAVEKARKALGKKDVSDASSAHHRRIQFHTLQGILYLEESEIISIAGKGSYCQINLFSGEKHTISKNIGQMEEKLSSAFFRCHNSNIINLDAVIRFVSKAGYTVVMKDGSTVEVSRRIKDKLLQVLSERAS